MRTSLAALADAIQTIEQPAASVSRKGLRLRHFVSTGWLEVDRALGGGLRRGAVHEWFGVEDDGAAPLSPSPQAILIRLAERAIDSTESRGSAHRVLWIGRRCWPYPCALLRDGADRTLLDRSVFVDDPPDLAARVWAIDSALRSSAVTAVVADGRGVGMADSRRLQLAAEAGDALALIARPPKDMNELSAAFTRWQVHACAPIPSAVGAATFNPRWMIELLRCKGMRPSEARPRWALELDREKGIVNIPADVVVRSGDAPQTNELVRLSA